MDFQGQGLATTGETEALALIDSFTKTVLLIPLPNRQATTLVPRLLDELYFRRGFPDVIQSDDAPKFLSDLMTQVATATGTQRTSICGHSPQSNGEMESWWRFWNRAMRYLPPSQYTNWPQFAQRICFAYNSVPHDSIGKLSPFEMDFAAPPQSPLAHQTPQLLFQTTMIHPTRTLHKSHPKILRLLCEHLCTLSTHSRPPTKPTWPQ
jgi:hypothetical protein